MNQKVQERLDYVAEQVELGLLPKRKPNSYSPRIKKTKEERAEIKARYYQKHKARFHEWYLNNKEKKNERNKSK